MSFYRLYHFGDCILPPQYDLEKHRTLSNSIYSCDAPRCPRKWRVNMEQGLWEEIELEKVNKIMIERPTGETIPINGFYRR